MSDATAKLITTKERETKMNKQALIASLVYGLGILIPATLIGIFVPAMAFIPLLMICSGGFATLLFVVIAHRYID
jgi:hypothetical protein